MNERLGILKASTRHSAMICYALASGAPSLYISLVMASEGLVTMGVIGPAFDQLVNRISQAMLGLGGKGASVGAHRFLKSLSAVMLLAMMIGAALLNETGLGYLPGDEAEQKRAKEFAYNTLVQWLIGSGFLLKQATQLGESAGLSQEKAVQAGHLLYASALLLAYYTVAHGDRDSSIRLFENAKSEIAKSLDEIDKGLSSLDTPSGYQTSLQQMRIALQKEGMDKFFDALPQLLLQAGISFNDLSKELVYIRRYAGFYAACLTTGIEQVRAPSVGTTQV